MKRLRLTIELLEDLHIGTGTGFGDIDASQVRDRHDHPVLPASHIKGVLRETALEAHRLQPQAFPRELLDTLFGRSGSDRGSLLLTSGYWQGDKPSRPHIWGSTRIGEDGTAHDKTLRFVEYIPAGSRFCVQAELPDTHTQAFRQLLAHTPSLGAQRNRGHGLIRWRVEDAGFDSAELPKALPTHYPARLRLVLKNLDPICLPLTAHPGNLITTSSYIRGRALRGSVVALCLQAGLERVADTLLSPTLSWGDARPLPQAATDCNWITAEVVPIPRSIGTPKSKAKRPDVPWWVSQPSNETSLGAQGEVEQIAKLLEGKTDRDGEKLKRPKEEEWLFRRTPKEPWIRYRAMRLERLHTRVPRPDEGMPDQALFSTEEIAEHTIFLADLIVSSQAEADALQAALKALSQHWLRLGRGGHPVALVAASWLELPSPSAMPGNYLTLFLESDLILRNRYGNFITQLDARSLADAVGLADAELETVRSYSDSAAVFGFNAMTGLPRSAQQAVLAGSVVAISGPQEDVSRLHAALRSRLALGESCEEGFGRFRLEIPQPDTGATASVKSATPSASGEEQLAQEAHELASRLKAIKPFPSRSQWGELRSRALAARDEQDLEMLFARLEEASAKLGGKDWKGLVSDEKWKALRQEINSGRRSSANAQRLLDYTVRWVRAVDAAKGGSQ
jgi:CRISPR/Cas system CSM-associated protein Csm3 (group 7 of RAMP superfamily)